MGVTHIPYTVTRYHLSSKVAKEVRNMEHVFAHILSGCSMITGQPSQLSSRDPSRVLGHTTEGLGGNSILGN